MTQRAEHPTAESVLTHIRSTLVEMFDLDPDNIQGPTRLIEDLELDSIDAIDLMVSLQQHTGKRVDQKKFEALRTIDDVVELVLEDLQR